MKTASLFFFLLLFTFSTAAQERFVRPVDEGPNDASFVAFRNKLLTAIDKRDTKAIVAVMDPRIKLSFGGDTGIAAFRRIWKPDSKQSKFWDEFGKVLRNGGNFDTSNGRRNSFYAPYTFSSWPDDLDSFEYQVIFGNNVNLRSAASMTANVVGQLSYNVVKVDYDRSVKKRVNGKTTDDYEWLRVTTLGGKTGFVNADYVRSSIDYRAGFTKVKGKWRFDFFVAGD